MQILKRFGIILIFMSAAGISSWADQKSDATLALLRERLSNSIGKIPWNPAEGYALEGQFILKTTGEDIPYRARYMRASNRWVSDFSQADPTRNLRYVFSDKRAWVASPEITVDLKPDLLPYMVRFDFYQLYHLLIGILEKGTRDPFFSAEAVANEIHVGGKLPNGWDITFVFNTVDFFPRKVSVVIDKKSAAAWLVPFAKPDGSGAILNLPRTASRFEIWLSDPANEGAYRYPRRTDFVEDEKVVGTFFLEKHIPIAELDTLFVRPPDFPWAQALHFEALPGPPQAFMYLRGNDLAGFQARMRNNPWFGWNWRSHIIALWAMPTAWVGHIYPYPISFRLALISAAMLICGIFWLLLRRRRQTRGSFRWGLFLVGFLASFLIIVGWVAAYQFRQPRHRSLIALHAAIRRLITDQSFYSGRADSLLHGFGNESPARSMVELGESCQAYALAYDLIRRDLPRQRQVEIESALFRYARPLFGATKGWFSNAGTNSVVAAGLGMVGLALNYEPYIITAGEAMDRSMGTHLVNGMHQSGPGPGVLAMDSAVNLFFGLKASGRTDYYANESFRNYLDTILQMITPAGTLPLFGSTSLDQADRLSEFLRKVASHVPAKEGRQCIAASTQYEAHGRYQASGWIKWILPPFYSLKMVFENPYLLFHYTRYIEPSSLPSSSAILGDGQSVVFRTGADTDAAYLALNIMKYGQPTHRDLLTFDLYAYGSLLLHGSGFPGIDSNNFAESAKTAASNSITLNDENQSSTRCTGITSRLLNQPTFDYVRVLADTVYDYGRVQRDIVMVHPDGNRPAYFLLLDDIFTESPGTSVQWHLHGRGTLETGIAHLSRWTSTRFEPPRIWRNRVVLDASFPTGIPGDLTRKAGKLYAQSSFLDQGSESMTIEWTGSRRICCVLTPHKSREARAKIETIGNSSFSIGTTDWICLGRPDTTISAGPIRHVSEYVAVRDQASSFPALLMVSGRLCQIGSHAITSTKPVTASLNGLNGGIINTHVDTEVEIRTPAIQPGAQFLLDEQTIIAEKLGVLRFVLQNTGTHLLQSVSR